jgi:hypothetical protein
MFSRFHASMWACACDCGGYALTPRLLQKHPAEVSEEHRRSTRRPPIYKWAILVARACHPTCFQCLHTRCCCALFFKNIFCCYSARILFTKGILTEFSQNSFLLQGILTEFSQNLMMMMIMTGSTIMLLLLRLLLMRCCAYDCACVCSSITESRWSSP